MRRIPSQALAVAAGGALAFVAGARRHRYQAALAHERAARVRSEFSGRAGRLLEAPPEPHAMLDQIVRLAVPDMAELCVVDLVEDGRLRCAAAFGADPDTTSAVQEVRVRFPLDPSGTHPVAVAARTGRAQLLPTLLSEELAEWAASEEHFELMLRVRYSSALVVPLAALGRTLGVMSFLRFEGQAPYTDHDLELAREVCRRAALAFDNARLFADLRRTEGQLEAVLGSLAAAVTVLDRDGKLVYVNQVAAEMLGCETPDAALSTPVRELVSRFLILDEDGAPFDFSRLPGRHALAGEPNPTPAITHSIEKTTGHERWAITKATPVYDALGNVVLAVNVVEDITDARRAERQQRFLAAASKLVSSSLDIDVTLDKVAWAAVPDIADWCCVDVPDERGVVRRAAIAADASEREALDRARDAVALDPDHPGSPARPLRTGESVLIRDLTDEVLRAWAGGNEAAAATLRAAGARSALVVPMTAGDRVIGLVTLGTSHSARRLGQDELALAEELGRRAGIAVENARLHATRSNIATTLQRGLLPPRLPTVPGVTIAARFRAAGETSDVGGDFYDLFAVGDAWMVVVGDVTGKGPAAATITSLARYTVRTAAMYERSPGAVLARLNAALALDPERRQLCTAVCARIEPRAGGTLAAVVACGGHPPPFLLTADGAEIVGVPGPLLGAFDGGTWQERDVTAGEGDALVFYTDGVTDTRGSEGERFGQDRLGELLVRTGALDAEEVASRIDGALQAFERGPQRDDVALLVLRAGGDGIGAPRSAGSISTSAGSR